MAKFIAAVLITLTLACSNQDKAISTIPSIEQGIWGRVEVWGSGSQVDSDNQQSSGQVSYARQRLFVFAKTHIAQLTPDNQKGPVYFKRITSDMVATMRSDDRGYFEVALPEGEYSVFVEVDGRLYANHFDDYGYAEPAEVSHGQVVRCGIRIMPQPNDIEVLAAP